MFNCQVPIGQRWVVERLGKFSRTLEAGAHRTWPLIESVRSRLRVGPRMREILLRNAETIDGARPRVALRLELEIVDAAAATYNVAIVADATGDADSVHSADADHAVAAVAESHTVAARAFLSRHSRAALSALQSGDAILDDADAEALRAQAAKWGIKIIGVTHEIIFDHDHASDLLASNQPANEIEANDAIDPFIVTSAAAAAQSAPALAPSATLSVRQQIAVAESDALLHRVRIATAAIDRLTDELAKSARLSPGNASMRASSVGSLGTAITSDRDAMAALIALQSLLAVSRASASSSVQPGQSMSGAFGLLPRYFSHRQTATGPFMATGSPPPFSYFSPAASAQNALASASLAPSYFSSLGFLNGSGALASAASAHTDAKAWSILKPIKALRKAFNWFLLALLMYCWYRLRNGTFSVSFRSTSDDDDEEEDEDNYDSLSIPEMEMKLAQATEDAQEARRSTQQIQKRLDALILKKKNLGSAFDMDKVTEKQALFSHHMDLTKALVAAKRKEERANALIKTLTDAIKVAKRRGNDGFGGSTGSRPI